MKKWCFDLDNYVCKTPTKNLIHRLITDTALSSFIWAASWQHQQKSDQSLRCALTG